MNNSDVIVDALARAGVRWVFGVPSGPVLPLIESLRQSSVEFVLTASETSAGFMATTVGYLTGVPGVCVSTVGPGATNLTTGVGCAWLDRSPVLAITCNVATAWLKRRTQMRIDHRALFKPITKKTFALGGRGTRKDLARALSVALAEPPGPVHLDLPEDVAQAAADAVPARVRLPVRLPDRSAGLVQALAPALANCRRPLVATGLTFTRGNAAASLLRFIETQNVPFVTTLHGKGFLPESHPNWAGVIGRARRSDVQAFTGKADLIIAVGYDPIEMNYEEWVGSSPIVHISSEAADSDGRLNWIWNQACDVDRAAQALAVMPAALNGWMPQQWQEHRSSFERALRPAASALAAHQVLDRLREMVSPDAILAYDVGAHTHQIASQWRTDYPKTLLATNGWSSMGYGMPAAYAAKLALPERQVIAVVGDGGFQMTAGELSMARRLNLQVPVIVLNDGWLGLMKIKQERRNYPLSGVYLGAPPDSPQHYFGVPCQAARTPEQLRQVLAWALSLRGPCVVEAFIDVEPYSRTVFD